ncbi:hypothetical protein B9Q04_08365 [Candidatus Marsarchaeota G2 archaeon BE_D]|uniref:Uncharacterized protein n=1 Tax=Candidatus Marsarchaeota G2 archaeon BE_D TaxID=1978158 RepID=A0A2R6CAJ5_9ARCH|nr:MAG: hypothetical protein B9Q04_08365 [Candidatus Marsarchaeota G2 archaeon BE_D]
MYAELRIELRRLVISESRLERSRAKPREGHKQAGTLRYASFKTSLFMTRIPSQWVGSFKPNPCKIPTGTRGAREFTPVGIGATVTLPVKGKRIEPSGGSRKFRPYQWNQNSCVFQ